MDKNFCAYQMTSRTVRSPFYKSLQKSRHAESPDLSRSGFDLKPSSTFKKRYSEMIADFEKRYDEAMQESALHSKKLRQNFKTLQKQQQSFDEYKKSHQNALSSNYFSELLKARRQIEEERSAQKRFILDYCDKLHSEVAKSNEVEKETKAREEIIRNLLNKEVLPVASKLKKLSKDDAGIVGAEEQKLGNELNVMSAELASFSQKLEMRKKRMEKTLETVELSATDLAERERKERKKMTAKLSQLVSDTIAKINSVDGQTL